MSNGGNYDIVVEALEVLPRRFTPLDDGVRTLPPAVGLGGQLCNTLGVKHALNLDIP